MQEDEVGLGDMVFSAMREVDSVRDRLANIMAMADKLEFGLELYRREHAEIGSETRESVAKLFGESFKGKSKRSLREAIVTCILTYYSYRMNVLEIIEKATILQEENSKLKAELLLLRGGD